MQQPKLGPIPKRIPLYVTKNVEWSKLIVVPAALVGATFVGSIRKDFKSTTSYPFTFTVIDANTTRWSLPAAVSTTMPVDCTPAEFVYTVLMIVPGQPQEVFCTGPLTLAPRT